MIPLPLRLVAQLAGGGLADVPDPERPVTGPVVADSRQVTPGGLFVAIRGARVDGHAFAEQAVSAGAVAVLADHPVGVPAIIVDDTVRGLGRLAHGYLDLLPDPVVIGITGSSGKTSTKDLGAQVLARLGPTVAPTGSLNTEVGLPLTVLRADRDTRFLVLEKSARGVGHIAYLCRIAPPRIGVVLNVGSAHLGEFGSREAIAQAKGELVEALPADGTAVLNADDPLVLGMRHRTRARVVTFGTAADADVRATEIVTDAAARPSFRLCFPDGTGLPVALQMHGVHHVSNALAIATVAWVLGLGAEEIAAALREARPLSRWRMEVTTRDDGVTVINDAYNANPESMTAALTALAAATAARRIAVLGPMAELGPAAPAAHAEVGETAARVGVDWLIVVGADATPIADGARRGGLAAEAVTVVPDAAAATALLTPALRAGDVVVIKASRSYGLEQVAAALLAQTPAVASPVAEGSGR
ncbi:MAG: UDP-N-acetylmuramoyl-tripeptide--D-alanyl-D-alanine ligase [Acidothermus cellulolyticus]|nr:UDP-N-acetylmuramoyl-tripeptide--D-alanyl-D-alanine ligase [Acidothermus cellulolyticus]